MRVIKFRVWDCELKEMIYDAQDESGYESDGFTDFLHQESRYKVMQFTGLLDKSGKEIWEGDILKSEAGASTTVVWDTEKGAWSADKNAFGFWNCALYVRDCEPEVLGNIYENPELLKQSEESK